MTEKPIGNFKARDRRQKVRAYKLHADGMTVREIAALLGKTEHAASQMVKIGKRFAENGDGSRNG